MNDISEQGRATQGVKLIRVDEGDEIAAITQIEEHPENGPVTNGNGTDANAAGLNGEAGMPENG